MLKDIRVRFAPSPTGYLHVGGLRTALYNFLFAKKNNGKLILRIEDTDRSRFVENATENLIKSLEWAGIFFDESPVNTGSFGPYIQSERLNLYAKYAEELLNKGMAYYAFDTSEELDAMRKSQQAQGIDPMYNRSSMKNSLTLNPSETSDLLTSRSPHVVRLLVPDKILTFKDIIRGEITVHGKEIDDQILLKSDGYPTYHLANVVDDHLMEISHVIRGEEWLPSTPKHIIMYDYFGWDRPEFAHLPLLLNPDKTKLSKRQGDVSVEDYIAKGYFRDALVNFIALLGWNPSSDREIYSIQELIDSFNLEKVNKAGAVFDIVKLDWMNAYYLHHTLSSDELVTKLYDIPELKNIENDYRNFEYLKNVVNLFRERIGFLKELPVIANYMFTDNFQYDYDYKKNHWKENTNVYIREIYHLIKSTDDFSHGNLHDLIKKWTEEKGIKLKEIIHPIRFVITGKSSGAGMFETMEVLGKARCIKRFEKII